jgi:hypothetical protein
MDTGKLKKFAQHARRLLIEQVSGKLALVLSEGSLARRENPKAVAELEAQIAATSKDRAIEQAAYTWFNRFCALRFMDVKRYTRLGVVSPAEGFLQPEVLMDAKQGVIDDEWRVDRVRVLGLLDGSLPSRDGQQEAYQLLLIGACNRYHALMPFLFEKLADWTELLIPDDLLSDSSILTFTRQALYPEACADVEVIGWLYQFYISEKKEQVDKKVKSGGKVAPDEIPAKTALFTPHWIVRYLVENSLGRLWMLNHPESKLVERMEYYIRPEEPETDFLKIASPEEIKVCDPACGSGHMLTYAFDLLYAIYEEQGYQATDIPRLILQNNLYGVEIDQRAGALAAFALTMKAREKSKRFLSPDKVVQPNICVLDNIRVEPEELSAYMDKVGRDLFTPDLVGVVNQWEEVDNFGSLIRPLVTDVSELLELLRERKLGEDLFLAGVHQKVLRALRQADYLSARYHVVVANPPYMNVNQANANLKSFVESEFQEGEADLYGVFILRNLAFVVENGLIGMITIPNWMFLISFRGLREILVHSKHIQSLVHLGRGAWGSDFGSCAFVLRNGLSNGSCGMYKRLFVKQGEVNANDVLEARFHDTANWPNYIVSQQQLASIPNAVIGYWATPMMFSLFEQGTPIGNYCKPVVGLQTGDNERFIRYWYEPSSASIGYGHPTEASAFKSQCTWFPYTKGGDFRKWYGNNLFVVNWRNGGADITAHPGAYPRNRGRYFSQGLAYSNISISSFAARYTPEGFIFDQKGSMFFAEDAKWLTLTLGYLHSALATTFLELLCPTVDFNPGTLVNLPIAADSINIDAILSTVNDLVSLAKDDWDASELSWNFVSSPLLMHPANTRLDTAWRKRREFGKQVVERIASLEAANSDAFAADCGFNGSRRVDPDPNGVTVSINPKFRYGPSKSGAELDALLLADTMREFISYAVGCMLGRYSLDKPGLILANQGETFADYLRQVPEPTFAPDKDNVIPLLDGDWFGDDISERFKKFLKATFGDEHYDENLKFLEDALYPDNATARKRKTIRDYFLKEFYDHHVKLYKKRPIYWLFSSPKGTFNALIYMHRYRPDTVSVVLNEYLREFQTKLRAKLDHLQAVADSGDTSASEKTKALKAVTDLKKQLKELEDYERDVLFPLASEQVTIDLDDGVKVNYNKFGKALKKVVGLSE